MVSLSPGTEVCGVFSNRLLQSQSGGVTESNGHSLNCLGDQALVGSYPWLLALSFLCANYASEKSIIIICVVG